MVKCVREKAGVLDFYGQNPIEWSDFMSKKEIDDIVKSEGLSHIDAPLVTKSWSAEMQKYSSLL
jgi:hypothetical protein